MQLNSTKTPDGYMSIQGRLTDFVVDREGQRVFAGDDKGLVYSLDFELRLVAKSPATTHGVGLHAITLDESWVYTRDVAGNVVRWRKSDLAPIDFIVSQHFTGDEVEEGATPVPSPSNALACIGDKLAVCNAYGTVSILDRKDFRFITAIRMSQGAFPECINAEDLEMILVSDVRGRLYRGQLDDKEFEPVEEVLGGVIHSIVMDHKFDRFWCTSDYTGGVFFLNRNGKFIGQRRITNDDVEEIAFDSTYSRAFVGCFDHYVHVLANQETPKEIGYIGPFKFQINHIGLIDDQRLLVLLESGELHLVETATGKVSRKTGGSNALWNLTIDKNSLICASERGNIETFEISSQGGAISFRRSTTFGDLGFGRIRQVACCADESFLCVSTSGEILKVSSEGEVLWHLKTEGILRDLAIDEANHEAVACNELGEIVTFDMRNGEVRQRYKNNKPVWCIAYDEDGHIVFGERVLSPAKDKHQPSRLVFLDRHDMHPVHVVDHQGNHKRIRLLSDHRILFNGNGNIGIQIMDTRSFELLHQFHDWIINTPENALLYGNRVYVISYGYQLLTYDLETAEVIDVQYVTEGYPKGLELYINNDGIPFLIAGGRNFLMAFRLDTESPELVATRYLFDTGCAVTSPAETVSSETSYLAHVAMGASRHLFERTVETA